MGQKVHPIGFRLGVNKFWESQWLNKKLFPMYLKQDLQIRKYIKSKFSDSGIDKIEIERTSKTLNLKIFSAKPGKIIGKQGKGIDALRVEVASMVKASQLTLKLDVFEVKQPDLSAHICATQVAQQLEKRIAFRRAMKKVIQQSLKGGAKGIKIRVAGRLNGAEMARTEWYLEGRVPLHTIRADIDYGVVEAMTTYGKIGVKVWIFRGEVFNKAPVVLPSRLVKLGVEE